MDKNQRKILAMMLEGRQESREELEVELSVTKQNLFDSMDTIKKLSCALQTIHDNFPYNRIKAIASKALNQKDE